MNNMGGDTGVWMAVFMAFIVASILAYIVLNTIKFMKDKEADRDVFFIKTSSAVAFLIIIITLFYFSYGSEHNSTESIRIEDTGMYEINNNAPPELSIEELKKDRVRRKPEVLLRQDSGFEKEKKEADEYIKSLVKEAKENEK